jgi:arylsulfatase A-like enzyme
MNDYSRRSFCRTVAGSAASLAMMSGQATQERPNIVYILADDLGWGDSSSYNPDSAIPMPNTNRLASQGMRFLDMHSSSAVCSPSRYSILTGRYCWRTRLKSGVLDGYSPNLIEPERTTVPSLLKTAGYYTAGVGKWHLGLGSAEKTDYSKPLHPSPIDHGFDYYFGIPASLDMPPYLYFENDRVVEQPTGHTDGSKEPRGVFWRAGAEAPSFQHDQTLPALTAKTVDLIHERAAHKSQPFFLYFAMTAPHTPWLPLKPFRGKSKAGDYGDFVCEVDAALGQVLDALDQSGLSQNTIVIFASDNGADWKLEDLARFAHRANADWHGEKADIWEGGHRIPFLVRWPGHIRAGAVSPELGCLSDLMATVAAIQNVKLADNSGEDSFNLLPAFLETNTKPIRPDIIHHSINGMFSIRRGEWKLEEGLGSGGFSPPAKVAPAPGGPKGQLYNLAKDPAELNNVYQKYPDIVDNLATLLQQYKDQGHTRPLSGN